MPALGSWQFSILCATDKIHFVPKKLWSPKPSKTRKPESNMFRLKVGIHQFVLLCSMLTILLPQTLYDLALHWLWSSYINVSWQNTECGGRLQTDWRITCVPYILPRLRPAHIPAYTPAPPKILSIHPTLSLSIHFCILFFTAQTSFNGVLLHLRACTDIPFLSYVGYDV